MAETSKKKVEGTSGDDFPSFDLIGKKALVTGATKGMGRHAAVALANVGADVFLSGRHEGELAECAQEVRALGRRAETAAAELADVDAVRRLGETAIETMGGIDVLVNNAGVALLEPVLDVTVEKWDAQLDVNLKAPFFLAQTVARAMVESGRGGKIINISSTAGLIGVPKHAAYCASKGGLLALTKTLAFELGPHNIQVNAICPAIVMTPMGRQVWDHPGVREEALEKMPVGRFGKEVDVSAAVVYLASSASDWMSGSQLVVDGGLTAVR
ncbi:MAG: glucose 1-dehydrogenase [Rubrobacter sp.]|jgi:NAD(P)-dependent dehydrogenase (short-subunit alcohol dehydrogenase family)|nr:glucose 1-dehydrogenase [Rubrobacter sp.]